MRHVSVDQVVVAVADAGGGPAHLDLVRARIQELDVLDDQGLLHLVHHGRRRSHGRLLAAEAEDINKGGTQPADRSRAGAPARPSRSGASRTGSAGGTGSRRAAPAGSAPRLLPRPRRAAGRDRSAGPPRTAPSWTA